MILCVGLVVDFAAHVAHAYTESPAHSHREVDRSNSLNGEQFAARSSLDIPGRPSSWIFDRRRPHLLVSIMVGVVLFGWSFGVIFLPVVLSYIGPLSEHDAHG